MAKKADDINLTIADLEFAFMMIFREDQTFISLDQQIESFEETTILPHQLKSSTMNPEDHCVMNDLLNKLSDDAVEVLSILFDQPLEFQLYVCKGYPGNHRPLKLKNSYRNKSYFDRITKEKVKGYFKKKWNDWSGSRVGKVVRELNHLLEAV